MNNNEPHYETMQDQLNAQQEALVKIYKSVEQTRKIIFWSGIANLVVFVLPLIFVAFALPTIMNTFTSSLGVLNDVQGNSDITNILSEPSLRESLENLKNLEL